MLVNKYSEYKKITCILISRKLGFLKLLLQNQTFIDYSNSDKLA